MEVWICWVDLLTLKWQFREKGPDVRDQKFEFRDASFYPLVGDMVCDKCFHIGHDLGVAGCGCRGHFCYRGFVGFMEVGGLGEEHEGDCEEAFDPFDELVAAVRLVMIVLMSCFLRFLLRSEKLP